MIFGRAVWNKSIENGLGGNHAVVPIEVLREYPASGEKKVVSRSTTSSTDGHIVILLKELDGKYSINIDVKNAEKCPERFKNQGQ